MAPRATDYAWAAGIIDGEGAVAMTRALPGVNRRKTMSFQVRISVRMTHRPTIWRLHKLFGGTFKPAKARDPHKHKSTFDWFASDLLTVRVLEKVLPYLTTKRAQAKLVLEYRKRCANTQPHGARCSPMLVKRRARYHARLKKLNQKGPAT